MEDGVSDNYWPRSAADLTIASVRAQIEQALALSRQIGAQPAPAAQNPLEIYSHSQLIHEMLRRGYAVMKVPEGGKPDLTKD